MTREWKPGDAAVLACGEETCPMREHRGLLGKSGRWYLLELGEWWDEHGSEPLRPLVVIDPEDRERVLRLALAVGRDEETVTKALRSLIEPPKPEEPTGLGAVVEDADGLRWVHRGGDYFTPWVLTNRSGIGGSKGWEEIAAVRVLSEGVQS